MKAKAAHYIVREHAEYITELLRPACARIEIAGSLRRGKADIGDIEIVALPLITPVQDMFGAIVAHASKLDPLLNRWQWPRSKNGPLYKQYTVEGRQLDLFICTPQTWAVNLLLRTGSAAFSQRFVTDRRHGGMLPAGYKIKDAQLHKHGEPLYIEDEPHLFNELGLEWVPPEKREE